jgi:hypothetical protein
MVRLVTFGGFFAGGLRALLEWGRDIVQSNPDVAKQLHELKQAFRWREGIGT